MNDDDIIFEAYKNYRRSVVYEDFDYFEDEESLTGVETKSFETPKSKLTEDEAKEFFANSDDFHQAFHDFMKKGGYKEKEVKGKELWCKCKNSKVCDEDEQQIDPNQQAAAQGNQQQQANNQQAQPQANNQQTVAQAGQQQQVDPKQQTQEIINSLSQMTPDQINQVYQAIFG